MKLEDCIQPWLEMQLDYHQTIRPCCFYKNETDQFDFSSDIKVFYHRSDLLRTENKENIMSKNIFSYFKKFANNNLLAFLAIASFLGILALNIF